jgi:hypothetical protein
MGNTLASGSGTSFEVGKNCEKLSYFTSNIELIFMDLFIYKIKYNNSKYGKACLAGTQDNSGVILSQNKYFNFQWQFVQNEDTGDSYFFGNHTKKCEKNSLSTVEILRIDPIVLQANHEQFKKIASKFKNDSDLDKLIKKLIR